MLRNLALIAPLLALAACTPDRMQDAGTWQPKYVNDANLRAMLANPSDLVAGQAATGSWGQEGASAVQRIVEDKVREMPGSNTTTVSSASNAPAAPSAAPGQ